jgi:hypothetical protein
VLDRRLVETIAAALGAKPGLVEKDWHVVRVLAVLASLDHGNVKPAFSGGTALSKGWGLIKRFSEDIDFKIAMPPATTGAQAKKARSAYREHVLSAIAAVDLTVIDKPLVGNESRFFSANLSRTRPSSTPATAFVPIFASK